MPTDRRLPPNLQILHPRPRRTDSERLNECFDCTLLSFNIHLDPPVVKISNSSPQASPRRFILSKRAVENALNSPTYEHQSPYQWIRHLVTYGDPVTPTTLAESPPLSTEQMDGTSVRTQRACRGEKQEARGTRAEKSLARKLRGRWAPREKVAYPWNYDCQLRKSQVAPANDSTRWTPGDLLGSDRLLPPVGARPLQIL